MEPRDLEQLVAKIEARLAAQETLLLALVHNAPNKREIRRSFVSVLDPSLNPQIRMQLAPGELGGGQAELQLDAIKDLLAKIDAGVI